MSTTENNLVLRQYVGLLPRKPHILLAATGSVAAIKVPELARALLSLGEVRILATDPARHFFTEHEVPVGARPVHGAPCRCAPIIVKRINRMQLQHIE